MYSAAMDAVSEMESGQSDQMPLKNSKSYPIATSHDIWKKYLIVSL